MNVDGGIYKEAGGEVLIAIYEAIRPHCRKNLNYSHTTGDYVLEITLNRDGTIEISADKDLRKNGWEGCWRA